MRLLIALFVASSLGACASIAVGLDEPEVEPDGPAAPTVAVPGVEPPVDPPESVEVACPIEPRPSPRPLAAVTPPPADAACRRVPRRVARELERKFRERWWLGDDRATLAVEHGCDRLAERIAELIVETSNGHGFTLRLDRVRPRPDGDYDLLRLEYGAYGDAFAHDPPDDWDWTAVRGARVRVGVLPGDRFESALLEMRAALQLRGVEKLPPPRPGELGGSGMAFSSRDFHVAYRIVDENGNGAEGFWVGYEGSDEQQVWLPLDLAARAYTDLVAADDISPRLTERNPNDEDRDFFAERFATARERNAEYGYWYLRERLLGMARTLGDARLMTDLLDLARQGGDSSEGRTQMEAVDVLVLLIGFDPRYDDDGNPRTGPEAAALMLARCG